MTTNYLPYLKASLQAYCSETGLELMATPLVAKNLGLKVLMVSPHPDDETINGALALRLKQNYGCEVFNFPFGFGSNPNRKAERKQELIEATKLLNFTNLFDQDLETVVSDLKPHLIIFPHADDGHLTHSQTHMAVINALQKIHYTGLVALTEFWFPNRSANLLLEVSVEECALLMEALSAHFGEIKRNPYHLRLPFWMLDNTRRGSELIMGAQALTNSLFLSNLYQIKSYKNGVESAPLPKKLITLQESMCSLFQ